MAGVVSYGAHIPRWRMDIQCVNQAWGRPGGKGERSVANFDEDSITMGVSSALSCLNSAPFSAEKITGLYFASTTPPYREKSSAGVIATALDLKSNIRAVDYGSSLKASTAALLGAVDAVKSQNGNAILVTSSDCRLAEPGSPLEPTLGDASASLLVGNEDVAAEVVESCSVSNDILDLWRRDDDPYIVQDDVRFAQIYGFQKSVSEVIVSIMDRTGLKPEALARVVITPIDQRSHTKAAAKLGFDVKTQLLNLPQGVGLCGVALPPLLLAAALEEAEPGDRILLVAYGDGADGILLEVTEKIRGVKAGEKIRQELREKRELNNYNKYLTFNNLIKGQEPQTQPFSSTTLAYREQFTNVRLYAKECQECGKVVFLRDIHVCPKCYALDRYKPVKLGKQAILFTFNQEYYYPSPDAPTTMAVIDFPEGARITTQLTDVNPEDVKADMQVELCLRKFHDGNRFHNYFWKCRPRLDE